MGSGPSRCTCYGTAESSTAWRQCTTGDSVQKYHLCLPGQGKGFSCEAHRRFRRPRESTQARKGFCTCAPTGNLVLSSRGKAALPPPLQLGGVKGATPSPAFLLPCIWFEPPPEALRRAWEGGIHSRHHRRWDAVIRSLLIRYPGWLAPTSRHV